MTALSCQEIRERIVDGDEDPALRAHAERCAECAPILAALDGVGSDLAALEPIDAPDALVESTLARVRDEAAAPVTVGSPSLLAAAFAMLTSAIGALVTAPVIAVRWLLGVGSSAASNTDGKPPSIEERGKAPSMRGPGWAPVFAMGSLLVGIVAFATFSRFGATVKTKTRGAEAVVNGLPIGSPDEPNDGWWSDNAEPERNARTIAPSEPVLAGVAEDVPVAPSDPSIADQLRGLGYFGGAGATAPTQAPSPAAATGGRYDWQRQEIAAADQRGPSAGDFTGLEESVDGIADETLPTTGTFETAIDEDVASGEIAEAPARPAVHAHAGTAVDTSDLEVDGRLQGQGQDLQLALTPEVRADRGRADGDDDGVVYRRAQATQTEPSYWDLAQATTGLTFASSESWWANTYVPGDAQLRMLHARLAASPGVLPGSTLSALALAESAMPTVPAVAAPTDRALAIGVHADTTAIEGPTRVRMEIALRAIDQAAGRRGALRIALVVDARNGLGTDGLAHLRSLLAALSHSLSPRDRVILTAAGNAGGTLVPLGVLRHGQVEVALRHLADTTSITGEATPTTLADALSAGLEAVAVDDDGAALALLVTPDGSHDAGVDQALHLGAIAGVPTTSVGIDTGASTASLDAIALAGEGRRRIVLGDDDAARAVREELTAASRLVARALRVRIHLADGVQLVDVVGSHALDADETRRTRESERAIDQSLARRLGIGQDRDEDDSGVRILVPSFYAGDSHTIVLDLLVSRPGPVADVDVRFKDLVRLGNGTASSALALEAGTEPRGPRELRVVASYVGHDVAGALDEAADRLERGDVSGARARLTETRALLDQARAAVTGLDSVRSIATDAALLDRFVAALDGAGDRGIVAASLHYAAARRIVIPQLQASGP